MVNTWCNQIFLYYSFIQNRNCLRRLYLIYTSWQNSMEQSPSWEAKRSSADQDFLALYGVQRLITALYKSPSLLCILCQINPVHAPPSHVLKIHFNIILPSIPMFSKWSPSLRFPNHNSICTSSLPPNTCHMTWPCHLYLITWIVFSGLQIMKLIMQASPLPYYLIPLRPKYLPQHPVLKQPSASVPPLMWKTKFHTP